MPIHYIRRKVAALREEPEPVRLRAVSLLTIGSAAVLLVVWVGILLPLQLRFNRGGESADPSLVEVLQQAAGPLPSLDVSPSAAPQPARVGGVQDLTASSPTPSRTPFISAPPALPFAGEAQTPGVSAQPSPSTAPTTSPTNTTY